MLEFLATNYNRGKKMAVTRQKQDLPQSKLSPFVMKIKKGTAITDPAFLKDGLQQALINAELELSTSFKGNIEDQENPIWIQTQTSIQINPTQADQQYISLPGFIEIQGNKIFAIIIPHKSKNDEHIKFPVPIEIEIADVKPPRGFNPATGKIKLIKNFDNALNSFYFIQELVKDITTLFSQLKDEDVKNILLYPEKSTSETVSGRILHSSKYSALKQLRDVIDSELNQKTIGGIDFDSFKATVKNILEDIKKYSHDGLNPVSKFFNSQSDVEKVATDILEKHFYSPTNQPQP